MSVFEALAEHLRKLCPYLTAEILGCSNGRIRLIHDDARVSYVWQDTLEPTILHIDTVEPPSFVVDLNDPNSIVLIENIVQAIDSRHRSFPDFLDINNNNPPSNS